MEFDGEVSVRKGERLIAVVREDVLHIETQAEAVRLTVLQTLGFSSLGLGAIVALTGPSEGSSFRLFGAIPGWPWLYGTMLVLFAAVLLFGVFTSKPWLAWYGTLLSTAWYAMFALGFTIQWWEWANMGREGVEPAVYPVAVYIGSAAIHLVMAIAIYQRERGRTPKSLVVATQNNERL